MENIYEWLYDHYCRPYQENVRAPFASHIQSAEQLLIRGGGTALDREDALNFCLDGAGISAFAAGIRSPASAPLPQASGSATSS